MPALAGRNETIGKVPGGYPECQRKEIRGDESSTRASEGKDSQELQLQEKKILSAEQTRLIWLKGF